MRSLLVIACVALIGCFEILGSGGKKCSTGISVSAGTVPRFSWASGCRVQSVTVSAGSACGAQFHCWQIESIQQNGISSAIRYGAVPSSATEVIAPVPLQAGQQYLVSIDHYDGGLRLGVASESFTP